jgi:hypothetical protein
MRNLILKVIAHIRGSVTEFAMRYVSRLEILKSLAMKSTIVIFSTVSQIVCCMLFLHFYPEDAGNIFF